MTKVKFLADESCDFIVVRTLRSGGYDVLSVAESFPSVSDLKVIQQAIKEERILLTEDKDFGEWVFAHGKDGAGVILIRFPGNARTQLGEEIRLLMVVRTLGFPIYFWRFRALSPPENGGSSTFSSHTSNLKPQSAKRLPFYFNLFPFSFRLLPLNII